MRSITLLWLYLFLNTKNTLTNQFGETGKHGFNPFMPVAVRKGYFCDINQAIFLKMFYFGDMKQATFLKKTTVEHKISACVYI